MRILAHISDLHFGRVIPELSKGLLKSLEAVQPDLVVISGDLTQRARKSQFKAAQQYLLQIPFPKLVVPGNHDVPLYNVGRRFLLPLKRYKEYISEELSPSFQDEELAVLGINTARSLTWTNGRISSEQMARIRSYFCEVPEQRFKILVTHHPFLPPPDRAGETLVGSARKALRQVEDCNLNMLLAGHFHMSYAGGSHSVYTLTHSILVIQAGTAISSRIRREKNAYNVITIDKYQISLSVRMWDRDAFTEHRQEDYTLNEKGEWGLSR